MVRKTLAAALGLCLLAGCETMNHSSKDCKDGSCSMSDMKSDAKMSKADLDKCGDECLAKGNAMKADAMKMPAGDARDEAMKKADAMIKDGQSCKEKAAKM